MLLKSAAAAIAMLSLIGWTSKIKDEIPAGMTG